MRRRVVSFLRKALLCLAAAVVVFWVVGFLVVGPVAKAKISRLCNGAVYVRSGQFKGFGSVRLKGVVIAGDADSPANTPVFRFDEIQIAFNPWKLLRGKFEVSSIFLENFLFNADYDTQAKQWNFQNLVRAEAAGQPGPIPLVMLRRGTVQIRWLTADAIEPVTTFGANGQIAVQTEKDCYNFTLETDERFGFEGSRIQGVLTMGQGTAKNQLLVQGRLQMPQAAVFENSWNLENIQLECEFNRQEVILKRCGFSMKDGQVDVHGVIRRDADSRRTLDVTVKLQKLELSDRIKKDAIVYSEPVLALLDSELRGFLTEYHPAGVGDMDLSIQGHLDDLSTTVLNGVIVCRDIAVEDEEFPYQLEQMQGTIEFSGRNLTLNQLKCRHDDVELLISGSIHNLGPTPEMDFRTTSPNMRFDADLYRALSEPVKKMWFSFTPQGTTAVDYYFQRFADGTKDFTLTLGLIDADMVYEHFPYPLENLTGTVTIKPNSVELKQLVAHYDDDRKVKLDGQVLDLDSPQPNFKIHVQGERIPVDANLIEAMPAAQREFFAKLDINAVADVNVVVFPNVAGERFLDYVAKIQLDGERLKYSGFPLPVEDVHLAADVTNDVVRLNRFEGNTACGRIVMSGTLTPKGVQPERPGVCLDLNLSAFDFNETFWDAARQDARRILGKLRLYGRMDAKGRLAMNFPADSPFSTDLVIQCSDNPVLWDANSLGQASGSLHVKGQSVLFEGFKLAAIQLETVPQDLLEGRLKTVYAGIEPQGKVDLRIDSGFVRMDEGGPRQIDLKGAVTFKNASCGHGGIVTELFGQMNGHFYLDREKKTGQVAAAYDMDHFKYRRWQVSNMQGALVYDPNTSRLEAKDFSADLYGGKLGGSMEVDLSEDEKTGYKLGLSVNDVDVPQLLAAQVQETPEKATQGQASGELILEGDLQSASERRGKLKARIVNMQLGNQSLVGEILTAVQLKQPDKFLFSEVESTAFIRGAELKFEDMRMVGKPLVFRGQGKLNLENRQIEMDLVAFDRWMGTEDTILDLLARGIGSAIWKVEVRGDMDNPKVDAVFLSVLKQPLDMFKKKE